jgi:hypothetical protein
MNADQEGKIARGLTPSFAGSTSVAIPAVNRG